MVEAAVESCYLSNAPIGPHSYFSDFIFLSKVMSLLVLGNDVRIGTNQ
jgi:hypothetical protein